MTTDQKIVDFWATICAILSERECILLFKNMELIIILLFFCIISLILVEKCPNSYSLEHCSPIMGNKQLHVTIMTDVGCEEITNGVL